MNEQTDFVGVILQMETCSGKTRICETHYRGYKTADGKKHFTACSGRSYSADARKIKSIFSAQKAA